MILRIISTLLIYVTVGRWIYAEINLLMPGAIPTIDYVLQATSLPTHDKWPKDSMNQLVSAMSYVTSGKGDNTSLAALPMEKQPTNFYGKVNVSSNTPSWRTELSQIASLLKINSAEAQNYYPTAKR